MANKPTDSIPLDDSFTSAPANDSLPLDESFSAAPPEAHVNTSPAQSDEINASFKEAVIDPLFQRGISDENYKMLGGDGPVKALRPLTNIPADVVDLGARVGTAAMAIPGQAAQLLDAGIDDTGINDSSLVKNYLPGAIHPGAAAMQLMEAFPDVGLSEGMHPSTSLRQYADSSLYDQGRAAIAAAVKDPTKSLADVEAAGLPYGIKPHGDLQTQMDYYRNPDNAHVGVNVLHPDESSPPTAPAETPASTTIAEDNQTKAAAAPVNPTLEAEAAEFQKNSQAAAIGQPVSDLEASAAAFTPEPEPTVGSLFDPAQAKPKPTLEEQAQSFQGSKEPTLEDLFGRPKTAAEPESVPLDGTFSDKPTADADEQDDIDHAHELASHVDGLTKDWTNSPRVHVVRGLDDIEDSKVRQEIKDAGGHDAYGFYGSDGHVYLNANNIHSPAEATGVLYHETLGHHGLTQQFGDGLDKTLQDVYDTNPRYKAATNQWMKDNPGSYKGDSQIPRALEEVLAEESSKGKVPPPTVKSRIVSYLKGMGRKAGIKLKYTDPEVNHILAMAHDKVVNGTGRATPEGVNKFMYGGERAAGTGEFRRLEAAKKAERNGDSVGEESAVRKTTGWFKAKDGKWRNEFADNEAYLHPDYDNLPVNQPTTIKNVMAHDDLFKRYPAAGDIGFEKKYMADNQLGGYDPATNKITINSTLKAAESRKIILHEIQHYVQDIEGHARGGNESTALMKASSMHLEGLRHVAIEGAKSDIKANSLKLGIHRVFAESQEPEFIRYRKAVADFKAAVKVNGAASPKAVSAYEALNSAKDDVNRRLGAKPGPFGIHSALDLPPQVSNSVFEAQGDYEFGDGPERRLNRLKEKAEQLPKDLERFQTAESGNDLRSALRNSPAAKFKAYENLHGEMEARDVEARAHMTDAERRDAMPYQNENVPYADRVVAFKPEGSNRFSRPKSQEQIDREETEKAALEQGGSTLAERVESGLYGVDDLGRMIRQHAVNSADTPQSFDELKDRAALMDMSPSKVIRNSGARGIAEAGARIHAMETTTKEVMDGMAKTMDAIDKEGITPALKQKLLQQTLTMAATHAAVEGRIADVARALNSLKIMKGDRVTMGAMMDTLKELGGPEAALADDQTFARFAKTLQGHLQNGNPQAAANVAASISKPYWWQYGLSLRHNFMLSGLGTQVKNTMDNLTMVARELEETAMAVPGSAIRAGLRKAGAKNVTDGVSPEEAVGRAYGLMRAALDIVNARRLGPTGNPIPGSGGALTEAKYAFKEGHHGQASKVTTSGARLDNPHIPVIGNVGNFLHAQDQFFRAFLNNANMYSLGIREARTTGLTGKSAFRDGVNRAMNPTPEMIVKSNDLANIALLVDKPALQFIEQWKQIRPNMTVPQQAQALAANILFPFFRVTDRLIAQKIRRSPLSFLDQVTRDDFMAGGPRRDIAISRTLMGSALIAYYWHKAGLDQVTGNGDPQKNTALANGGYMPNATTDGKTYTDASALNLSLNPKSANNAVAANVANLRDAYYKGADHGTVADGLGQMLLTQLHQLAQDSFLSGINQYTDAMTAQGNTADQKVGNVLGSLASSFIVPAMARQFNGVYGDPVKRDTKGDGSIGDIMKGRIESGIPGLSKNLPMKYNAYGQPEETGKSLSGIGNYQTISTDPVITEVQKIEKIDPKVLVNLPGKDISINGEKIKLTGNAYAEYTRQAGQNFYTNMKDVVTSDQWPTMSDEDKAELIKKTLSSSRKDARTTMFGGPQ